MTAIKESAGTGDRTRTSLRTRDFKSRASANFATPAIRAGNGTRTRDPNLGKVVLYQLSYSRAGKNLTRSGCVRPSPAYGGEGDRTPDLVNAIHALSQLSYAPANNRATAGLYWRPAEPPDGNTACYRGVSTVSSHK